MNLYEIDSEILKCLDEETGEILDADRIESLSMERDDKIKNIALWYKDLKAESEALKAEKDAFAARQHSAENKMRSLKDYLEAYLNGEKVKTTEFVISYRKSEAVEIQEQEKIPKEFLIFSDPSVNKTAVKEAIKKGTEVPGASIIEHNNMQIR